MTPNELATLVTIAGAPVIDPDAPLGIAVTAEARQILRAHDAPVPRLRRREEIVAAVKRSRDEETTLQGDPILIDVIDVPAPTDDAD